MRLIFLIIITTILSLLGYYIYTRAMQAFAGTFVASRAVLVLYIFLISSFFIGKIVEQFSIGIISNSLVKIGAFGIGVFLYAFLIVVFLEFIRLVNFLLPFYPKFVTDDFQKTKFIVGIISFSAIIVLLAIGYINALYPKVKEIEIEINKSKDSFGTLNVVAISDIHLGTMVNKSKIKRLISEINQLKPDVVLIAGDMIDDNIDVVKYYKLLEYFKELNPKYGVYACPGNHEYISRAFKNYSYFAENGINILSDTVVNIDNKFQIIGRDDIESKRILNRKRKSLSELTVKVDFTIPVFLLDHQPYKLNETAEYAIDFQFSGHTHNGQIWPFNYITGLLFEEDWGYLKKTDTHFYISAGYGTAVMPFRVGNHSEIVHIKIINRK